MNDYNIIISKYSYYDYNKSKSNFTGNQYISNEIMKTPLQSTSIKNDTHTI